jgi:crossover junction endodeoxyribonuclease RuvC
LIPACARPASADRHLRQHPTRYVASGCVKTDADGSLPQRIATILDGLAEIIATYQPQQAAVEIVFVNVNPQSTLLLGQARGAAIAALVAAKLPVAEYTALQVKQAVVGHGKAAKEQVQAMVARLLKLPGRTHGGRRRRPGLRHCPRPWRARPGRTGYPGQARARRAHRLTARRPPSACCWNCATACPRPCPAGAVKVGAGDTAPDAASDIMNALLALGYNERETLSAMKALAPEVSVADGIRQALKLLSKSS